MSRIKSAYHFVGIMLFPFLACVCTYGQAGALDPSFSSDGKVTTSFTPTVDYGSDIGVQSDEKIIVGGIVEIGSQFDLALLRYHNNGVLDSTFGINGLVTTNIGVSDDYSYTIAIQSDDKIIMGGYTRISPFPDFCLVRYLPNGILDTSFGVNGIVTTDFAGSTDEGIDMAIQPDGKIVLAGNTFSLYMDFAIARYNSDGSIDSTFGFNGMNTMDFNSDNDFVHSMALQQDGKIVVVGQVYGSFGSNMGIARFNANGSYDFSFSSDARLSVGFGFTQAVAHSVAVQTDGKIVLVGSTNNGTDDDLAIARIEPNGTLDAGFDSDGQVLVDFSGATDLGRSVVIQNDGFIIFSGHTNSGTGNDFFVGRVRPDGSMDVSFDADGIVTTDFGLDDVSVCSYLQPDGRILIGGYVSNWPDNDFAVARYLTGYLGVENIKDDAQVVIFPNPFTNVIGINLKDPTINPLETEIRIFDVHGKVVWKQNLIDYMQYLSLDLNSGFYYYDLNNLQTGMIISSGKLIAN